MMGFWKIGHKKPFSEEEEKIIDLREKWIEKCRLKLKDTLIFTTQELIPRNSFTLDMYVVGYQFRFLYEN